MPTLVGRTLGKYQITERLGKGGMAEVYKAYHPKLERHVVIKVLHSYLAEGEDFLARFEREAKAVASLRHQHIVQIHDFDVQDDLYYMVMEFIDGGTLQSRMIELSKISAYMPVRQVLSILQQVAEALDYAHKRGIVHRDIKPSNILLDASGNAFLADFGISRMMGGTQFTTTGALIGTPTYMSPEQGMGLELTRASDVYSLGIVIYELLTGKVPFTADTPFGIIHKHISEPLLPPGALRPNLPPAAEAALVKALEKEPKNRFQSAMALCQALEKAFTEEAIDQLDGTGSRAPAPVAVMPTMLAEEPAAADRAHLPTEAISDKTRAEITGAPAAEEAVPKPPGRKRKVKREKQAPAVLPPEAKTIRKKGISPRRRLKAWPILLGVIGLIGLGALILILSGVFTGPACPSPEACLSQAATMGSKGDLEGYVSHINAALDLAPVDQHQTYAALWCDRGDAEMKLGKFGDAEQSYNHCDEWTEKNSSLASVRIRAQSGLSSLPSRTQTPGLPPVEGPEPSARVAAFYYPFYGNLNIDGWWNNWQAGGFTPPLDISSDFYPLLGAYSANDPMVIAQHFAWLRQAGVGLIISGWWGQNSFEDRALPALLAQAERYGIKVAIHIENYSQRNAQGLLEDIQYLYRRYGGHPAFYRTTDSSPWIQDDRPKGLFFVFNPWYAGEAEPEVQAEYWRETLDAIHDLPDSGIVIAATTDCSWIERGHFDGLYNYVQPHLEEQNVFNWSRCLPPGAWYVPSVIPGDSPLRFGSPEDLYEPRRNGETYNAQWDAALGTGVQPRLVTITSFNNWHEGTQIEPAAYGKTNVKDYTYDDYESLGEQGYLTLTRYRVDSFMSMAWPPTPVMRIHITTTADWTSLLLLSGGDWIQPEILSASEEATAADLTGNRINLNQKLNRSQAGKQVELVVDVSLLNADPDGALAFEIQRGNIGWTKVEIFNLNGSEPVLIGTYTWAGTTSGLNPYPFQIPTTSLVGAGQP